MYVYCMSQVQKLQERVSRSEVFVSRRRRRGTNSVAGSWVGDFGVEWTDGVLMDGVCVCMEEAKEMAGRRELKMGKLQKALPKTRRERGKSSLRPKDAPRLLGMRKRIKKVEKVEKGEEKCSKSDQ